MLGTNANQIAKYCNQHQNETPNYEALERNISELRERLDEIWRYFMLVLYLVPYVLFGGLIYAILKAYERL